MEKLYKFVGLAVSLSSHLIARNNMRKMASPQCNNLFLEKKMEAMMMYESRISSETNCYQVSCWAQTGFAVYQWKHELGEGYEANTSFNP